MSALRGRLPIASSQPQHQRGHILRNIPVRPCRRRRLHPTVPHESACGRSGERSVSLSFCPEFGPSHHVWQEALLAVTNAHEGTIFVNTSVPAAANVSQYALELFPEFGLAQAQQVRALYADVGTPLDQTAAIYGDGA